MVKSKDIVKSSIKKYISALQKQITIEKVILFGSWANGNPNSFSDIDLAIFSPDFGKSKLKELQLLSKLSWEIDESIEAIPYPSDKLINPVSASFIHEIIQTGEVIYDGTLKQ